MRQYVPDQRLVSPKRLVSQKNKSPAAIFNFRSAIIFFTCIYERHRQFLGQKVLAAGDLLLVKLATRLGNSMISQSWVFIESSEDG